MEFKELIKKRYSVRAYKADDFSIEIVNQVIEAANLAPTSYNRQSFRLFIIKTTQFTDELKKIYSEGWFTQAPYVIGICSIPKDNWVRMDGKNYSDVDSAIVMDHIILAATNLGLGTCWVADFDPFAARHYLDLSSDMEPIAFTPLGYPADIPQIKRRKPISKIVHFW